MALVAAGQAGCPRVLTVGEGRHLLVQAGTAGSAQNQESPSHTKSWGLACWSVLMLRPFSCHAYLTQIQSHKPHLRTSLTWLSTTEEQWPLTELEQLLTAPSNPGNSQVTSEATDICTSQEQARRTAGCEPWTEATQSQRWWSWALSTPGPRTPTLPPVPLQQASQLVPSLRRLWTQMAWALMSLALPVTGCETVPCICKMGLKTATFLRETVLVQEEAWNPMEVTVVVTHFAENKIGSGRASVQ